MELLIALRSIRSDNEILEAGDRFVVENGQVLVDRGYARHLTGEETKTILNEYARAAEDIFSDKPASQSRPSKTENSLFHGGSI